MNKSIDTGVLEKEIEHLRAQLYEAQELRDAISLGQVDAFVVGPDDDAKRVLLLSGAYGRYRQLVEDMQQGALTTTRAGEILFANDSFAALLGVTATDLFRAPLHNYVAPAERAALDALLLKRARHLDAKVTLLRRDGAERRVRMALVSGNEEFTTLLVTELAHEDEVAGATIEAIRNGSVDALVIGDEQVVMLDSAQRFYHAAVERMQQGVIIVGASGDIAYANHRMAGMLAMPREKLSGARLQALAVRDDQHSVEALLASRNPGTSQIEVRLRRSDGEAVAATISVSAMADGQKMCLVSDLTLQKRHAAADERTRKFLAIMAHEFRNILAPIRNSLELLKHEPGLGEDGRKAVEIIERHSDRLVALVEDLRRVNPTE